MSPQCTKSNINPNPTSPKVKNQHQDSHPQLGQRQVKRQRRCRIQQVDSSSSSSSSQQYQEVSPQIKTRDYRDRERDHSPPRFSVYTSPQFRNVRKVHSYKDREGCSSRSLLFHAGRLDRGSGIGLMEKKKEVDRRLLDERDTGDQRSIRKMVMLENTLEGDEFSSVDEQERGRVRSLSDVAGGYAGYARYTGGGVGNEALGSGCGFGVGGRVFRGREPELEVNEVVLEGPLVALKGALLAGRFSDLTVVHGLRVWNAHKVVVCSQSAVLESMIDSIGVGNMFGNQARPSILNLTAFPLDSVIALMEYLYTSAYSIPSPPAGSSPSSSTYASGPSYSLPLHEQIFYLAVHLEIPAMETLATASFRHTLNTQISNLEIYFSSITRIYDKTTEKHPGLRNALVEAAVQELGGLLGQEGVKKSLWKTMSANEEFWEGVLRLLGSARDVEIKEVVREVRVPVEVERIVERILEKEVQVKSDDRILCLQCGPLDEDEDKYMLTCHCRICGEEKKLVLV
ncbi:hypothetical protein DID88_006528 [Monilinia fructigena]|uniref:BTB domain-containing protein n=1 Tax=Monilinia fructigena TaxID=38457 RepID=A0A395II26_9HELO|nr:hypothetical protein DID88_006528 [Monilinia fructigena]